MILNWCLQSVFTAVARSTKLFCDWRVLIFLENLFFLHIENFKSLQISASETLTWTCQVKVKTKAYINENPQKMISLLPLPFLMAVLVNWSLRKSVFTGKACKTCLPQIGIFKLSPSVWKIPKTDLFQFCSTLKNLVNIYIFVLRACFVSEKANVLSVNLSIGRLNQKPQGEQNSLVSTLIIYVTWNLHRLLIMTL